jgi:hypothetical protein
MTHTPTAILPLGRLCGRKVLQELSPRQSWLVDDPSNRRMVLKRLDDDCLLPGRLHPTVRDRLARIRELAHPSVANLHGVERDGDLTVLVWEYLEGAPLDQRALQMAPEQLNLLLRELVLCVQALHALGIVHGAIHGRNVIIQPDGAVRLTHVSPLLYTEPAADLESLTALLRDLGQRMGAAGADLVAATELHPADLDSLRARLGGRRENVADVVRARREHHDLAAIRWRSLLGAVAAAAGAGLLAAVLWYYGREPAIPQPPQAPPVMMDEVTAAGPQRPIAGMESAAA